MLFALLDFGVLAGVFFLALVAAFLVGDLALEGDFALEGDLALDLAGVLRVREERGVKRAGRETLESQRGGSATRARDLTPIWALLTSLASSLGSSRERTTSSLASLPRPARELREELSD